MVRGPGSHALRFLLGVDHHSAFGLRVQRDPLVVRGSLDPYDRLAAAGALPDVLPDWGVFSHQPL